MMIAAVPGVCPMLWLNVELYGSAMASGYGDATRLFSTAHIQDNLTNFGRALLQTAVPRAVAGRDRAGYLRR